MNKSHISKNLYQKLTSKNLLYRHFLICTFVMRKSSLFQVMSSLLKGSGTIFQDLFVAVRILFHMTFLKEVSGNSNNYCKNNSWLWSNYRFKTRFLFYKLGLKIFSILFFLIFSCSSILAQTGPGGIGNEDGSGGQPENVIWLEAESLGLSDGNDINLWLDLSGNSNDFSASSTYSPIFRNTSPLNGRAFAEFSKSNNRIVLNPFDGMPETEITTLVVYRTTDSGDGLLSYATNSQNNEFLLYDNSNLNTYIENSNHSSGVAYNTGSWQIMSHRWRSSDGDLRYFLNSTEATNTTHRNGSVLQTGGSLAIGGEQDAVDGGYVPGQAFQGDIAEVIMYNSYLNDAQRSIIENYLSAKYDISIGPNDYYAGDNIRNYEYGVIGIGIEANGNLTSNSSTGLVLTEYNGTLDVNGEYVFAGHDDKGNAVTTDSLGAGIEERWLKSWYLDKTTSDALGVTIAFDFSDGIGGQYPGTATDYALLRLDLGGTETYEPVTADAKRISGDQIIFDVADANLTDGFYTLGTADAARSPVDGVPNTNWYSYKTGLWNDPETWTTDPSGFTQTPDGGGIPAGIDNVEILNGRTVTMDADNISAADLIVTGELVVGTTSGHAFGSIAGIGTIKISGAVDESDNFPDGDATGFADLLNGGTLEINGDGINLDQTREFRNVFVDLDGVSDVALLTASWTIKGTMNINQGTLQVNDGTAGQDLIINAYNDVSVQSNGAIEVGTGDARHQLNMYGDFINSGTIAFTNRTSANYGSEATDGIVDVNFLSDTSHQTIDCLGPTTFYRIEIDKGDDQTYILDINASSSANFNLYGPADYGHGNTAQLTNNDNSLGLLRGTVRINNNVTIPVLNNTGNYNISTAARLWVNGGTVTKPSGTAIVPYGTILVSSGSLSAPVSSGITTRANGNIVVEGGVVTVNQIRTSVLGQQNIGGYTQSGGTVNVTGGSVNSDYYTFSLTYEGNTFNMSGGTLNISGSAALQDNSGSSGQIHGGALFINSAEGNYNVTGGDIIIDNTTNVNAKITSTAPLWNLTVTNSGGGAAQVELDEGTSGDDQPGEYETIQNPTLRILNNFTIEAGVVFDHNGYNVEIGSDFVIENGADYIYNSNRKNTTTLNGIDNCIMAFYNRIGGSGDEQSFWNLVIDRPSGKKVTLLSGKTNVNGDRNNLLRIEGNHLKVLSGTLDQGVHSIRLYTDTLVNYDVITLYDPTDAGTDSNPNSNNDLLKFRPDPFVLITADTSQFGNVRLNNGGNITTLISDVYIQRMEYRHGRINMADNNMKIDELFINLNSSQTNWNGCGGCNSVEDMFISDGNASDGGLSLYIDTDQTLTYPIGVGADGQDADVDGGASKYTPAVADFSSVTEGGYVTIRPVDRVLATTAAAGDILSYYWRVDYEGFTPGNEPNVSYQFTYYNADTDVGDENVYVPGKVLDQDPFTRSVETSTNINTTTNVITFNGDLGGGEPPFALEYANYTAGESTRFDGEVEVYYTRGQDRTGTQPLWTSSSTWTDKSVGNFDPSNPHSSANNASSSTPGPGDVAIIGFFPHDDPQTAYRGYPHSARINSGSVQAAKLIFRQMLDDSGNPVERKYLTDIGGNNQFQFRPTFTWNSTGLIDIKSIEGEGTIRVRGGSTNDNQRDPSFAQVDLGLFAEEDSSYLLYEAFNNFTINNIPNEVPTLVITNDGWGANDRTITIDKSFTTNQNLEIQGNANLMLGNGTTGDIVVKADLYLVPLSNNTGGGELRFQNSGSGRSVTIERDLLVGRKSGATSNNGSVVRVQSGGSVEHNLIVAGDIVINTSGSNNSIAPNGNGLLFGDPSQSYINLKVNGDSDAILSVVSGDAPELNRIIIDKGSNKSVTFTIITDFMLAGETNGTTKALDLQNGTLVLDNSGIDIDLTTGGDDFNIPSSAALKITDGEVNVSGNDSGIRLDGSLIIDGGTVDMDDAVGNGNNYIEYGSGGNALLEISDGILTVGSQIRPITTAETGVLKYRQTGGTVVIGKNAGGDNDRGMLQVYNTGSEFTYAGGTLEFVRHQASPAIAALYLDPDDFDLTGSTISIFNGDTPVGQNDFRINSTVPLNNLEINDTNSPTAILNINPLEIDGTLTINSNAMLDANGLTLTLLGDMLNDGTYMPNGNTTIFGTTSSQALSGSGTFDFYNLTKNEAGTLNLSSAINISNTFFLQEGAIDDGGNNITTQGNVIIDGTHSSSGGSGIVFAGSSQQQLSRSASGTGILGTITINNASGVEIPDGNGYNFDINGDLRLQNGVFNIGGALVSVAATGDIVPVSPFGLTNMVQTNSSFTDNGLKKSFPAGYGTDFTFPIGQLVYTPVVFDFSSGSNTFGTTGGSITVRPANEYHPTVDDGANFFTSGDVNNVLQYHWILNADNINGFSSDVEFFYDQSDVLTDEAGYDESDYLAASILSDNNPTNIISKFDVADVDEAANIIRFNFASVTDEGISGDYFAGIDEAIPDNVATYTSLMDGDVDAAIYDIPVPGGGAPRGAVLVVASGTTVSFNIDDVNLYKTEIQAGGTLEVVGTDGHRLGTVSGTGDLKLVSNTSSVVLPAGFYGDFFSCTGGGLEYAGTGDYNILGGISNIRNLTLSGTGNRNFPNLDITVCEDFNVNGPTVFFQNNRILTVNNEANLFLGTINAPTGANSRINIYGQATIDGGIFNGASSGRTNFFGDLVINNGSFVTGTSVYIINLWQNITFNAGSFDGGSGNSLIQIRDLNGFLPPNNSVITGDFTGANAFNNLAINKENVAANASLNNDIEVIGTLELSDGIINTNGNIISLGAASIVTPDGGQERSYINGRVLKNLPSSGDNFTFPIGGPTRYRPAYVQGVSTGGLNWEAEYFEGSPLSDPDVTNLTSSDPSILTMSTEEYWRISDGSGTPSGETAIVGLSWGDDSYVSANALEREQLRVMVWDDGNSNWDNAGGANYSGGNTQSFGMFNSDGPVSFSEKIFTLGSTDLSNPLPVDLVAFTGKEVDGLVELRWETASEQNNDYFIIEHSIDGRTFTEIGQVNGAGTVNVSQFYNFKHRNPAFPNNYYRLKQVDFDGGYEYFDAILVRIAEKFASAGFDFNLYPNPTSSNTVQIQLSRLDYSKPLVLEVVSLSGRRMMQEKYDILDLNSDITIDFGYNAIKGIYIVRLSQGNQSVVKKLVLK
jgi:hypothetical protein